MIGVRFSIGICILPVRPHCSPRGQTLTPGDVTLSKHCLTFNPDICISRRPAGNCPGTQLPQLLSHVQTAVRTLLLWLFPTSEYLGSNILIIRIHQLTFSEEMKNKKKKNVFFPPEVQTFFLSFSNVQTDCRITHRPKTARRCHVYTGSDDAGESEMNVMFSKGSSGLNRNPESQLQ